MAKNTGDIEAVHMDMELMQESPHKFLFYFTDVKIGSHNLQTQPLHFHFYDTNLSYLKQ